tara:strand:+ start:2488 stop:2715 length:228 start_codon:yes stop_codon:yes gene_type:complete
MADRNQLVQEKADLRKQLEGIVNSYNEQQRELLKDLNQSTETQLEPLNKRIAEINEELLKQLDQEAGIGGEACPA